MGRAGVMEGRGGACRGDGVQGWWRAGVGCAEVRGCRVGGAGVMECRSKGILEGLLFLLLLCFFETGFHYVDRASLGSQK